MNIWRYKAVPLSGGSFSTGNAAALVRTGELAGDSAADVRASLRRIGLQVIELRTVRAGRVWKWKRIESWDAHLRSRRQGRKAELFDSIATMLDAGMPLIECVETLAGAGVRPSWQRGRAARTMFLELREGLRSGLSFAEAMGAHPTWFDASEVAMVEAGQISGDLSSVLRNLSDRHERSGELGRRLAQALTYPAAITVVGLGVVVFLSTRTLPKLVRILNDAKIPTPRLTEAVMTFGGVLADHWPLLLTILAATSIGLVAGVKMISRRGIRPPMWIRRCVPAVVRQIAISRMAVGLAELVRAGVPLVDAVRAVAPTLGGLFAGGLRLRMLEAASRIERGESLSEAMVDPIWFDEELRRMLSVADRSGELDSMLQRLGERTQRRTRRLIDRIAALLEPAVIVILAALVGMVVMAAILPLIRMQEVIR